MRGTTGLLVAGGLAAPSVWLVYARILIPRARPARQAGDARGSVMSALERTSFQAMGTECALARQRADRSDNAAARLALSAAWNELRACERILSRFDSRSQLCELNRNDGMWVQVDDRLFDALARPCGFATRRTAVSIRRSCRLSSHRATIARSSCSSRDRPTRASGRPVRRSSSIRTGAAHASSAVRRSISVGSARGSPPRVRWTRCWRCGRSSQVRSSIWEAMSQWSALRRRSGPWLISVESPWRPGRSVGTIRLPAGGVATSGPARRRFGPGGELHHLIDPATGAPADAGPLAVTAVARDPVDADAHATALAVSASADDYVGARPGLGALVVAGLDPPLVLGAIDFSPRPVSFEVTL